MNNSQISPSVSVIIPCYNCEKWIENCLGALGNQPYRDFEVICVDDCSTDGTYKIIEMYQGKSSLRLFLMKNETNLGPAISRNSAAAIAKGKWLAFCDSDDRYDETFLEEMVTSAEQNSSELVMCEYRKIYETGKKSDEVRYLLPIDDNSSFADKLVYSKSSLCLLLIKRSIFLANPIPDIRNGEDIACIPCIEARAKKISVVKKPLYNYLIRSGSASNKPSEKVYKSLYAAYQHIEKNFPNKYPAVLEYLGIRTVLYGVTLNAFKAGVSASVIKKIVADFNAKYPKWKNNRYLSTFSKAKRIYLQLIGKKMFFCAKILAYVHMNISI